MRPLPHEYEVTLTGAPAGYAALTAPGLPDLTTAPPVDYDGPGDAWSPEHLLLAAVSACFLFTFRAGARAARAAFVGLDVHTSGTVSRIEGIVRFTDIVVRATVTAPPGADMEALRRTVDKAAGHCLVSSSLIVQPRIETTIEVAAARASPPRLKQTA